LLENKGIKILSSKYMPIFLFLIDLLEECIVE